MNNDLINIKKYYGEDMMHLCRSLFPSILEKEGLLFNLLESHFAYSKVLYIDLLENALIDDFKNYIYSLVDVEKKEIKAVKSPKHLLAEAGYTLYECKKEQDIQKFKKYYQENEKLCTFNGSRLDRCYVFFAVKKNVNDIKREKFPNPKRQDEYGTSVISIQFSKGKTNTLSIKNRYNHSVNNPDATFSNNLDNIIEGLTDSFAEYYKLNINRSSNYSLEIPNYVRADDGKFYKYNYEINNVYYCPNNIIIDNSKVIDDYQAKEKYLVMDYFIIDLKSKGIFLYDKAIKDSFLNRFEHIQLIEIMKTKENKHKKIGIVLKNKERIYIEVDENNRMLYYQDDSVLELPNNYLRRCEYVQKVSLPAVIKINNMFMCCDEKLEEFWAPKLSEIGDYFMTYNILMQHLDLPSVVKIGSHFLEHNEQLKEFTAENLEIIGRNFLCSNIDLEYLEFLRLKMLPSSFMLWNEKLKKLNVPNVVNIGSYALINNAKMRNKILLQVEKSTKIKKL